MLVWLDVSLAPVGDSCAPHLFDQVHTPGYCTTEDTSPDATRPRAVGRCGPGCLRKLRSGRQHVPALVGIYAAALPVISLRGSRGIRQTDLPEGPSPETEIRLTTVAWLTFTGSAGRPGNHSPSLATVTKKFLPKTRCSRKTPRFILYGREGRGLGQTTLKSLSASSKCIYCCCLHNGGCVLKHFHHSAIGPKFGHFAESGCWPIDPFF